MMCVGGVVLLGGWVRVRRLNSWSRNNMTMPRELVCMFGDARNASTSHKFSAVALRFFFDRNGRLVFTIGSFLVMG
jgi:hypothetical protein